jgi:hypothetical protein
MSDYEMASLFVMFSDTAQSAFANVMALITGMVALSWFVAHKLTRSMAVAVVLIFTIACFGFGNELFSLYSDFARLGAELHARGQIEGSSLGWLGPVRVGSPHSLAPVPWIVLTMLLLSYAGAIWFFIHARGRKSPSD